MKNHKRSKISKKLQKKNKKKDIHTWCNIYMKQNSVDSLIDLIISENIKKESNILPYNYEVLKNILLKFLQKREILHKNIKDLITKIVSKSTKNIYDPNFNNDEIFLYVAQINKKIDFFTSKTIKNKEIIDGYNNKVKILKIQNRLVIEDNYDSTKFDVIISKINPKNQMQQIIDLYDKLEENGKMCLIIKDNFELYSKTKKYIEYRKNIIKKLTQVIYLPSGIFKQSKDKYCILFFSNKKQNKNVKFYDFNPYTNINNLLLEVPDDTFYYRYYSINYGEYRNYKTYNIFQKMYNYFVGFTDQNDENNKDFEIVEKNNYYF